jgi:hypothetical protein
VSLADNGHYECRPNASVRGLVDVVWTAPQSRPRLLDTLAVGRLELLADALTRYLAEHRNPYPPDHPTSAVLLHTDPAEVATLDDLRAAKRRRLEEW